MSSSGNEILEAEESTTRARAPRIELMGVKGRFKALNRKNRLIIYISVSALLLIIVYPILANILTPLAVPDFELQVEDCLYNPSTGSFSVSGTIGIPVPRDYYYWLGLVSITDGNKTIDVRYLGFWNDYFSGFHMGPEWHFYFLKGITLESKNLQLTFEYSFGHGMSDNRKVLEEGTKVFSVSVE